MAADVYTDHRNLRVLTFDECLERLGRHVVGRLAFVDSGDPVVLPIAYGLDGTVLVFRTSWGSKLQKAGDEGVVAVEVDDIDPVRGSGWSVLVKGTASIEYDEERISRWEQMNVPYWLDRTAEMFWVRVTAEEVGGREIIVP